jgi:hypothetical protein
VTGRMSSKPTATTPGYRGIGIWPGITSGFNANCTCTWATHAGQYQVKYKDALCITHPRTGGAR